MPIQDPQYHKDWYEKNKKKRLAQMRERRAAHRDRIAALKEASPCTDCGRFFPWYVMQWDHIGQDKSFNIGNYTSSKWEKLEKEIAKCELVCANCHMIRTHQRRMKASG